MDEAFLEEVSMTGKEEDSGSAKPVRIRESYNPPPEEVRRPKKPTPPPPPKKESGESESQS